MRFVPHQKISAFFLNCFINLGVEREVAQYVVQGMIHASLRGTDSHGVALFPHYYMAVKKGRINKNPKFRFEQTSASTGQLNADDTFGHAAGQVAIKHAMELAQSAGSGHV